MSRRAAPRQTIPPSAPAPIPTADEGRPPVPPYAGPDLITTINASGNVTSDDGPQTIIDVVPDMRFHLLSWIYSIQHAIPASAYAASPHASPASLLAYTMIMMIGQLYFCDAYLRPSMTLAASKIYNDSVLSMFFNLLLDMPVPTFAINEFEALRPYFDDMATNLCFIPSLGGSTFLHDFGRHFPAATFISLHNLMANLPANTSPAALSHSFYTTPVASVTFDNGATHVTVTPSMMFGLYMSGMTNDRLTSNWLNQRINRIVTALAIRPAFTAPTIGPLPVDQVSFANDQDYSPYEFLTGLSTHNVNPMIQLVRSVGSFVSSVFPSSRPLRDFTQLGSIETARHLVFDYPVPTWTTAADTPSADLFTAPIAYNDHNTYAAHIRFAVALGNPTTTPVSGNAYYNSRFYPAPDDFAELPNVYNVQLNEEDDPSSNARDPIKYVTNVSSTRPNARSLADPNCLIFDPSSSGTAHLAAVIIAGKIIEEYDLSGATTPFPRPDVPLHTINGTLISGAVPIRNVRPAIVNRTFWTFIDPGTPSLASLPQGFHRGTLGPLRIPVSRKGIVCFANSSGATDERTFPGAEFDTDSRYPDLSVNFFGYHLGRRNVSIPSIHLWSSYRFQDMKPGSHAWYMLPSLLPIYGLRVRHHGSIHPSLRIP